MASRCTRRRSAGRRSRQRRIPSGRQQQPLHTQPPDHLRNDPPGGCVEARDERPGGCVEAREERPGGWADRLDARGDPPAGCGSHLEARDDGPGVYGQAPDDWPSGCAEARRRAAHRLRRSPGRAARRPRGRLRRPLRPPRAAPLRRAAQANRRPSQPARRASGPTRRSRQARRSMPNGSAKKPPAVTRPRPGKSFGNCWLPSAAERTGGPSSSSTPRAYRRPEGPLSCKASGAAVRPAWREPRGARAQP